MREILGNGNESYAYLFNGLKSYQFLAKIFARKERRRSTLKICFGGNVVFIGNYFASFFNGHIFHCRKLNL